MRIGVAAACACVLMALTGGVAGARTMSTTILRGTFPSNEMFVVNGVPTLFTFTCDEQRLQFPDGSARDTARCRLDTGETPPSSAAHEYEPAGYESDFAVNNAPGVSGGIITFTSWQGVVTPSGNVNMSATFAAP